MGLFQKLKTKSEPERKNNRRTAKPVFPESPGATVSPESPGATVFPESPGATVFPESPRALMIPESPNTLIPRSQTSLPIPVGKSGFALSAIRQDSGTGFLLRKAPVDHSPEARALRDEKWLFIKAVWDLHRRINISEEKACRMIADREENRNDYPLLSGAGKNRKNALHYSNYRNWVNGAHGRPGLGRLSDRTPDFNNVDVLLPNYGRSTELYGDEAFWKALLGKYLQNSEPTLSKSYYRQRLLWQLDYPEQKIPTLAMVRHFLRKHCPPRLLDYARKGENYYFQHYRNWTERDPDTLQPNEAWVADTQDCDFMMQYTDENGKIQVVRPKIVVIMDIKSEFVVSVQLTRGFGGNEVIRNGFAAAVFHYGRPKIFLTDNGTDYCKVGFTAPVVFTPDINGTVIHEHSILKELGVEHHKAEKYNARPKFVERFFREMAQYTREARGYVGNRPENRPASANVWAKAENRDLLMNEHSAASFIGGLVNFYHAKGATGSKYLKGLSPIQAFTPEHRYTRAPMNVEEYLRAFRMPLDDVRIVDGRGPSVRNAGKRYEARPEERHKLYPYDGKPVMLKFEMFSDDHCFVYDLDGTYLCECVTPELMPYFVNTEADREKLSARLENIRSEKKYLDTMLMDITGGWHRVDAQTTYQLPRESFLCKPRLKLVDSMYSVKGDTHNPKIYITEAEAKEREVYAQTVIPESPEKELEAKRKRTTQKRNLELERDIEQRLLADKTQPEKPELPTLPETINSSENQTVEGKIDENFF